MPVQPLARDLLDEALARRHREDAASPRTGGPAGNARLTAWTGLVLLVLIAAELVTVLDVEGLLSWHVAIGAVLVPVALLKTASTSWRFVRYYAGEPSFRRAGPPLTPLRVLGPLVVLTTWALLGTGIALIVLGPTSGRRRLATVLGQGLDVLTLHQASFIAFAVATGLHILARTVPAVSLTVGRRAPAGRGVPGAPARWAALATAAVAAVVLAVVLVRAEGSWGHDHGDRFRHHDAATTAVG